MFFIYVYSLFEGAIWQLAKSILYAFPEKLSSRDEQGEKSITIPTSCLNGADTLMEIIENRLTKMGKDNLFEYLTAINKIIEYKNIKLDKALFFKISKMRNAIVHNNSLKKYDRTNRVLPPSHNNYMIDEIDYSCNVLIDTLKEIRNITVETYSKYTKLKLLQDSWRYTVGNTFNFGYFINISKDTDGHSVVRINFENLEKGYKTLSSSERTMLALWIQQYSGNVNDQYINFAKINVIAALDVERLNYFIKLFNRFPFLMDGDNFENDIKENNNND